MCGLQGAGKTTTTAKIAGKLKKKGRTPLLVACDVYRPAAIEQLQINGEKQGVEVFSMGDKNKPADIAKAAVEHAKKNHSALHVMGLMSDGGVHSHINHLLALLDMCKLNDVKKNHIYKIFYDEFADIFDEFVEMDERNKNK